MTDIKRRSFLTMLGAVSAAPLLPVPAGAAAAPVYNRYMYGLAVFHARTRASITTADLMAKLRVSAGTAEAMLGEMSTEGVIAPAVKAASGAMRALDPHHSGHTGATLKQGLRNVAKWLTDDSLDACDQPKDEIGCPKTAEEIENGKV